jgi:polyhydroxybutyrate depolymerase
VALLFLLACAGMLHAQTRIDVTMAVDSVEREFIVSVPRGAVPAGGYPLVFVFHGTTQNGEKFWQDSQWKELGDTAKVLTVFPTGLTYCFIEDSIQRTTTKWHNGELEELACPGQELKNDVAFVRAMLDTILARFPVDRRRIYATGFSNGCGFTNKLAVEMSDVFAAAAGCGGGMSSRDSAAVLRPIPHWLMLGTLDDKWLANYKAYGLEEFPFNDSCLMWLALPLGRFLGSFNLADACGKTELGRTITYRYTTPLPGTTATEFRFTLVNDMYHVYPDGSNEPFKAAVLFWNFFQQFTLPLDAGGAPMPPGLIAVYPNPARGIIRVAGAREADVVLRDLLGRELLRARAAGGAAIRLPRLAAGTYVAEITTSDGRTVRAVAIR